MDYRPKHRVVKRTFHYVPRDPSAVPPSTLLLMNNEYRRYGTADVMQMIAAALNLDLKRWKSEMEAFDLSIE